MPMGSSGTDQDWISGDPVIQQFQYYQRERATTQKRLEQQDRMQALARALSSPNGDALMRLVTDQLAARLNTLAEQDEMCKAYLGVLRALSYELDIGRQASEALVAQSVGQAP